MTLRGYLEHLVEVLVAEGSASSVAVDDALAALAILDAADDVYAYPPPDRIERRFAYVYDPEPSA